MAQYTRRNWLTCIKSRKHFRNGGLHAPAKGWNKPWKVYSPSLTTDYIRLCYEEERIEVMGSYHSTWERIEKSDRRLKSLVKFFQLYFKKLATALKSTALVPWHFREVPLHVWARKRHWVVENEHTLVGFLPFCCSNEHLGENGSGKDVSMSVYGPTPTTLMAVPSKKSVRFNADLVARRRKMRILHATMKVVVGILLECRLKICFVKTRKLVAWQYVPPLVSNCCSIPKGKNRSGGRPDAAVKRVFLRCILAGDDITNVS